jgi:hypothetical protein
MEGGVVSGDGLGRGGHPDRADGDAVEMSDDVNNTAMLFTVMIMAAIVLFLVWRV